MIDLRLGDCLSLLPTIPDGSIDAIIADPPYPEISRDYGRMNEAEWHAMMRRVLAESRRILKSSGSAVFILQPNSEKVGRMRPWLWEFMAWTSREWNQIQDVWWWNTKAIPTGGATTHGLMRGSVKACVWLGDPDCYRNQDAVLWIESDEVRLRRASERSRGIEGKRHVSPSGHSVNTLKKFDAAERRGGVSPFNVIIANHMYAQRSAGAHGHGAGTPQDLCDWWTRYICPPGGTLCDPFMGSGTTGLSALKYGCDYIGIEKLAKYHTISERRIAAELDKTALFA